MKTHYITPFFIAIFLFGACSGNKTSSGKSLDDCPIVATQEMIGNDNVTTLHLDRVKDTLEMPVSQLLENFRIVRLDNRDEALIKREFVSAYDNYICTGGTSQEPCRLFDKTGHFLCQIGANGQGPGEYWAVYDDYVDEANNRIYLMPWNAKSVLIYDLEGQYLSDIPLPILTPKGVFAIDTRKQLLTVGLLPINEIEGAPIVWQQDFKGNILHMVEAAPYSFKGDYSSEVSSYGNISGIFDFSILSWEPMADTLYYFIPEENRLAPVMTLQQPEKKISHDYMELPNHYIVDLPNGSSKSQYGTRTCVIVDKKTQKGAYFRILNDLIGNVPIEKSIFHFKNGYFAYTMDPGNLLDNIEAALSRPDRLSEEQSTQLKSLQNSVNANDNNYLFIGKIKPGAGDIALNTSTEQVEMQPIKQKEPASTSAKTESSKQDNKANIKETPKQEKPEMPYYTAYLENWESYFRTNNKYKDWDSKDAKMTMITATIDKYGKPHDVKVLRSCNIKNLDEEAIRLIREATTISPAKTEQGEDIEMKEWAIPVYFPPK